MDNNFPSCDRWGSSSGTSVNILDWFTHYRATWSIQIVLSLLLEQYVNSQQQNVIYKMLYEYLYRYLSTFLPISLSVRLSLYLVIQTDTDKCTQTYVIELFVVHTRLKMNTKYNNYYNKANVLRGNTMMTDNRLITGDWRFTWLWGEAVLLLLRSMVYSGTLL